MREVVSATRRARLPDGPLSGDPRVAGLRKPHAIAAAIEGHEPSRGPPVGRGVPVPVDDAGLGRKARDRAHEAHRPRRPGDRLQGHDHRHAGRLRSRAELASGRPAEVPTRPDGPMAARGARACRRSRGRRSSSTSSSRSPKAATSARPGQRERARAAARDGGRSDPAQALHHLHARSRAGVDRRRRSRRAGAGDDAARRHAASGSLSGHGHRRRFRPAVAQGVPPHGRPAARCPPAARARSPGRFHPSRRPRRFPWW